MVSEYKVHHGTGWLEAVVTMDHLHTSKQLCLPVKFVDITFSTTVLTLHEYFSDIMFQLPRGCDAIMSNIAQNTIKIDQQHMHIVY